MSLDFQYLHHLAFPFPKRSKATGGPRHLASCPVPFPLHSPDAHARQSVAVVFRRVTARRVRLALRLDPKGASPPQSIVPENHRRSTLLYFREQMICDLRVNNLEWCGKFLAWNARAAAPNLSLLSLFNLMSTRKLITVQNKTIISLNNERAWCASNDSPTCTLWKISIK